VGARRGTDGSGFEAADELEPPPPLDLDDVPKPEILRFTCLCPATILAGLAFLLIIGLFPGAMCRSESASISESDDAATLSIGLFPGAATCRSVSISESDELLLLLELLLDEDEEEEDEEDDDELLDREDELQLPRL